MTSITKRLDELEQRTGAALYVLVTYDDQTYESRDKVYTRAEVEAMTIEPLIIRVIEASEVTDTIL